MNRRLRRGERRLVAAGVSLLLAGCSNTGSSKALPPRPPTFAVGMQEYRFEHALQASPGRVLFRAMNLGATTHELTMVRLRDDQVGSVQDLVLTEQALATVVILFLREPGSDDLFAVDLVPGRYGFICFTKDADGVQHVEKGMSSQLLVV